MADVVGAVGLEVQPVTKSFKAKAEAAVRAAMRGVKADVKIDGDFAGVQAQAKRASSSVKNSFQDATRGSNRALNRIGDGDPFGSLIKKALALVIAVGSVQAAATALKLGAIFAVAIPAVIGLTSAVVSLAGALGPLLGLFGALPGAIALLGTAFGVVALASRGVGEALKASGEQTKNAVKNAKDAAAAQERVGDATRGLARAQRAAQSAQESLTRARKQAREELEDLQLALRGAALGEEGAKLALRQAIKDQQELRGKMAQEGRYDALELEAADLRVRDAELGVDVAVENRADTQERANELTAKGIEGSDQVVDAQQRVRDSQESLEDAIRSLTKAQEDAAQSTDVFKKAMGGLSPAAQSLVNTLLTFKEPLKALSDTAAAGLFPGVEAGLIAMRPLFETLTPIIFATGQTMGTFVQKLGEFLGSKGFRSDLATIGENNNKVLKTLGNALLALVPAFTSIAVVAGPMVQTLADMAKGWADNFAGAVAVGRESGTLAAFFEKSVVILKKVLELLGNVFGIFKNIFGAAAPEGERLLDTLIRVTGVFENFTKRTKESGALGQVFTTIREVASTLWENFKEFIPVIITLFQAFGPAVKPLVEIFTQLVSPLLGNKELMLGLVPIIHALNPVIVELAGVMAELAPILGDLLAALAPVLILLAGAFVDVLGFIVQELLPPFVKFLKDEIIPAFVKLEPVLAPIIGGLIGLAVAFKAVSAVLPVLKILAVVFGAITSPIGLVVVGVIALGTALFLAYKKFEPFRNIVDTVGRAIRDGFGAAIEWIREILPRVFEALREFGGWLKENFLPVFVALGELFAAVFPVIQDIVETFVTIVTNLWERFGDNIFDFVESSFNLIKGVIEGALQIITGIIQIFTGIISGDWEKLWEGIKNVIGGAFDVIKSIVQGAIDTVINIFKFLYDILLGNSIIPDIINGIFDWFTSLPGRILDLVKDFASRAKDIFLDIKDKALEFIGSMVTGIVDFITSLPGKIIELVPQMIDAGLKLMGGLVEGIVQIVGRVGDIGKGVANAIIGFINDNVIDKLNGALEIEILGKKIDAPDIPRIPQLARGKIVDEPTLALIGEAGREVVLPLTDAKRTLELAQQSGLMNILAKGAEQQGSVGAAKAAISEVYAGRGSNGVTFGPGSVVVELNAPVTPEEARMVGEQAGQGIKNVMENQQTLNEARAL